MMLVFDEKLPLCEASTLQTYAIYNIPTFKEISLKSAPLPVVIDLNIGREIYSSVVNYSYVICSNSILI